MQKNDNNQIKIDQFKPDFSVLTLTNEEKEENELIFSKEDLPQVLKLDSYHYINNRDYVQQNSVVVLASVMIAPRFESVALIDKETNKKREYKFYFHDLVNNNDKKIIIKQDIHSPV